MSIFIWILIGSWAVFLGYWIISAFSAKRSIRSGTFLTGVWFRLAIFVVVIIIVRILSMNAIPLSIQVNLHPTPLFGTIGAILSIGGVSLAIWARTILGRNWGMPMSLKEDRELVTAGPYAYIRHPIYTALFLMLLGAACIEGPVWLLAFVGYIFYFVWAARIEEKRLTHEFPEQYPAYMARTKMLIPFIL